MIAITSIAPFHTNDGIQEISVQTWIDSGLKVYSLNCAAEIPELKKKFPNVEFISTHRTFDKAFGKPYVAINAMLDFAKDYKDDLFMIINSDIQIYDDLKVFDYAKNKANEGVIMIKRNDYENTRVISKRYDHGVDAFIIHKKFLNIFPQSVFCMGQTFWDYWIPYHCFLTGTPLFNLNENLLYHKEHSFQYKMEAWQQLGKYFQWENNLERYTTNIGKMSHFIYQTFMNYAK